MKSNDLVTKDVVSRSDVGWDSDGPGVVVGDELIGSPRAWAGCTIYKAGLINLEEFESSLVDCGAVAIAIRKVVKDWTLVRVWPDGPQQVNGCTGCHSGRCHSVSSTEMADDVGISICIRGNVAEILILWNRPSDDNRCYSLILEVRIVAGQAKPVS